jgi:YggT family protein
MGPLTEALAFVVRSLFGIAAAIFLIRFLMQGLRVDFRNPICQATYRFTNPVLQPLGKLLPTLRSWNLAAFVVGLLITIAGEWLAWLIIGQRFGLLPILVWSLGALVTAVIWTLFGMILIRVIASYLSADPGNPVMSLLKALTQPLLRPFQRLIPPIAGFDLSPMFAMLLLQVGNILIAKPLMAQALVMHTGSFVLA